MKPPNYGRVNKNISLSDNSYRHQLYEHAHCHWFFVLALRLRRSNNMGPVHCPAADDEMMRSKNKDAQK